MKWHSWISFQQVWCLIFRSTGLMYMVWYRGLINSGISAELIIWYFSNAKDWYKNGILEKRERETERSNLVESFPLNESWVLLLWKRWAGQTQECMQSFIIYFAFWAKVSDEINSTQTELIKLIYWGRRKLIKTNPIKTTENQSVQTFFKYWRLLLFNEKSRDGENRLGSKK
jgi:hypothetical protein